eukprot:TRINITY_DN12043_c0_g3_i1.p1 TRINITY_DN12043_c0_g3~~TRINITY_DN12043_c0_g3_i1.p1  ORF type:complete len:399 (+),score=88.37 TRINITY_DN12043_c0_g3_i1:29-1198(+)
MVQRLSSPYTVGCDRLLIALAVILVATGVYVHQELTSRVQRDWTPADNVDSLGWQLSEGLMLGFKGADNMTEMLDRVVATESAKGKRFLITGGNRGLGRALAARLVCLGGHVTITSRRLSNGLVDEILAEAAELSPCVDVKPHLDVVQLDLSDLRNVQRMASDYRSLIDVLILNAGLSPIKYEETAQGFESALGVNCIGHYMLTKALLSTPNFGNAGNRLVVVTSETARIVPALNLDTLLDRVDFGLNDGMTYYGRSKLALNTLTTVLTNQLREANVSVHSVCPGPVATDIARRLPAGLKQISDGVMKLLFQTGDQGGWPVVMLAADPYFGTVTGKHYHMYRERLYRNDMTDADKGRQLVELIEKEVARRLKADGSKTKTISDDKKQEL